MSGYTVAVGAAISHMFEDQFVPDVTMTAHTSGDKFVPGVTIPEYTVQASDAQTFPYLSEAQGYSFLLSVDHIESFSFHSVEESQTFSDLPDIDEIVSRAFYRRGLQPSNTPLSPEIGPDILIEQSRMSKTDEREEYFLRNCKALIPIIGGRFTKLIEGELPKSIKSRLRDGFYINFDPKSLFKQRTLISEGSNQQLLLVAYAPQMKRESTEESMERLLLKARHLNSEEPRAVWIVEEEYFFLEMTLFPIPAEIINPDFLLEAYHTLNKIYTSNAHQFSNDPRLISEIMIILVQRFLEKKRFIIVNEQLEAGIGYNFMALIQKRQESLYLEITVNTIITFHAYLTHEEEMIRVNPSCIPAVQKAISDMNSQLVDKGAKYILTSWNEVRLELSMDSEDIQTTTEVWNNLKRYYHNIIELYTETGSALCRLVEYNTQTKVSEKTFDRYFGVKKSPIPDPSAYFPNPLVEASALHNLSVLYTSTNRLADEEQNLLAAAELLERHFPTSLETATTLSCLGKFYMDMHQDALAEQKFRDAMLLYRNYFPNSYYAACTLQNVGALYKTANRHLEAEQNYTEALSIYMPFSIGTATTLISLGQLLQDTNRQAEAEEKWRHALRLLIPHFPTFIETGKTLWDLAVLYITNNSHKEALTKFTELLLVLARDFPTNIKTARAFYELGVLYQKMKRFKDAEKSYLAAVRIFKEYFPTKIDAAKAFSALGYLYLDFVRLPEAEQSYAEALNILVPNFPDSSETASALLNMGNFYALTDRPDKAENYLKKARKLYAKLR